MNLKTQLQLRGKQLSKEQEEAFKLWTFLPSFKLAEKYHGDYVGEFQPCVRDVIMEARLFISAGMEIDPDNIEHREWFMRCPCGEYCEEEEDS